MANYFELISLNQAREIITSQLLLELPAVENIPIEQSVGRICAETLYVSQPYPPFTRSAMDGYAVTASATQGAGINKPVRLFLTGEILMGKESGKLEDSTGAMLIHTGGMLPQNADAIVILEDTEAQSDGTILVYQAVSPGDNVILQGEDVKAGDVLLAQGKRITEADAATLASDGIVFVQVYEKVKIAIISIGDELISPEETPLPGQIRDINTTLLSLLCQRFSGEVYSHVRVRDDQAALEKALSATKPECRLVLITAGSSVSERDFTARVVGQFGAPGVLIHGIKIRPGKPTIFARCHDQLIFGLPGNPVSAYVIGWLLSIPVLRSLSGEKNIHPYIAVDAVLHTGVSSVKDREDFIPVIIDFETTPYTAIPVHFKSNLIFSLAHADGLLYIPDTTEYFSAGDRVKVYLHTQSN